MSIFHRMVVYLSLFLMKYFCKWYPLWSVYLSTRVIVTAHILPEHLIVDILESIKNRPGIKDNQIKLSDIANAAMDRIRKNRANNEQEESPESRARSLNEQINICTSEDIH